MIIVRTVSDVNGNLPASPHTSGTHARQRYVGPALSSFPGHTCLKGSLGCRVPNGCMRRGHGHARSGSNEHGATRTIDRTCQTIQIIAASTPPAIIPASAVPRLPMMEKVHASPQHPPRRCPACQQSRPGEGRGWRSLPSGAVTGSSSVADISPHVHVQFDAITAPFSEPLVVPEGPVSSSASGADDARIHFRFGVSSQSSSSSSSSGVP